MSIVYTEGKYQRARGYIDHAINTFVAILMKSGYTPDIDHRYLAALDLASNECSGTGYIPTGKVLSNLSVVRDDTNNCVVWDADDVSWASSTIPDVSYCVIAKKAFQNCTQSSGVNVTNNTIQVPDVDLAPYPIDVNDQVRLTSSSAIPGGLTQYGIYYVVNVDTGANTFQVATTQGGTAIDITSTGSGTLEVLNLSKSPLIICAFLSKQFTCSMTSGNTYVTLADDSDLASMVIGGAIIHDNIPEGSTVSSIVTTPGAMRFNFTNAKSAGCMASATQVAVTVEGVRRASSNSVFEIVFASTGVLSMR